MKTKLTPELQEKIIKYIRAGNYIETSCKAVGVSKVTFYSWLKRGKNEEPYANFLNAIGEARAGAEIENVELVQFAALKNWQAAAWWLERTNWKKWGRKDRLEVKTKKTVVSKQIIEFRKEEKKLTVEERKQLVEFTMKAIEEYAGSNGN